MSQSSTRRETFHLPQLDCPSELALVERGLRDLPGIHAIQPDYLNRTLHVELDPEQTDRQAVAARLTKLGLPPAPAPSAQRDAKSRRFTSTRVSVIAGGIVLLAAGVAYGAGAADVWIAAATVVSTMLSGWPVASAAWRAVRAKRIEMNGLMTIAAVGALATGQWFEAATAMFLFGVSLWLESFSVARARRAVQTLVELTPVTAHKVVQNDVAAESGQVDVGSFELADVDPAELLVGDLIVVKPGERVPVDGPVVRGASAVNEAALTGESIPVDKSVGDDVLAGSINGEGALEIRVGKPAGQSTLARIAELVERAQASRSPTERFVDRFAARYTPAVLLLAVCIVIVPPALAAMGVDWAAQRPWQEWFHRGLVLLVIACPCALVISTPVTIVCGLYRAARFGLLVKGGEHLEMAGRIDAMALDKTGTLTEGRPELLDVRCSEEVAEDDVLRIAAALETQSEHPLARAIVHAARDRGLSVPIAQDFEAVRGFGVRAVIDGLGCAIGSPRYFQIEWPDVEVPPRWLKAHPTATPALIVRGSKCVGAVYLADRPRDDAIEAIGQLRRLGVAPLVMLTGDSLAVAEHVAETIGIEQLHAGLLPEDKVDRVRQLAQSHAHTAMVGDGVNDSPALAASQLGIAFGDASSDTALETADVVVLSPRLTRLADLIRLGRRTRTLLAQNITMALAIKGCVLLLAAAGAATMWMAVAADVGASMLVIFNGMRILRFGSGDSKGGRG